MDSTKVLYFLVFVLLLLGCLSKKKRQKYRIKMMSKKNQNERELERMNELIQSLMGKDVYVKLLEGTADGIVKEVTDKGVVLEGKEGIQIINLDYIISIREYPYKNGKRAMVWSC